MRTYCKNAGVALSLCLGAVAVNAAGTPAPRTGVCLGAALIEASAAAPRSHMVIVTRGERISAVLPASDFPSEPGEEIVKVRDRYIIPGLVNTHVLAE